MIDGQLDAEFPLVVFQTGSGTQSNMNANEVIANRANQLAARRLGAKRPVHPNDHVNMGQSSNDAFPAVMHIAAVEVADGAPVPAGARAAATLAAKARAFDDVIMIGRTHLQDATPIALGQVIDGWVAQIDAGVEAIQSARAGLLELALGGTAVGTGLNAHPQFGARAAAHVAALTGHAFRPPRNLVARPRRPRGDGRGQRRAAPARRSADEDGQRRAALRVGPARRHRRAPHSRRTSPARRSCRAR